MPEQSGGRYVGFAPSTAPSSLTSSQRSGTIAEPAAPARSPRAGLFPSSAAAWQGESLIETGVRASQPAHRGRPHPPAPSLAAADRGRYPRDSGIRASRPGPPGAALAPSPSPAAAADRGRYPLESDWKAAAPRQSGGAGERLALPRFVCSPSPAAAGGEGGPGGPGREAQPPFSIRDLPLSAAAAGGGERVIGGGPSAPPDRPGCRSANAPCGDHPCHTNGANQRPLHARGDRRAASSSGRSMGEGQPRISAPPARTEPALMGRQPSRLVSVLPGEEPGEDGPGEPRLPPSPRLLPASGGNVTVQGRRNQPPPTACTTSSWSPDRSVVPG